MHCALTAPVAESAFGETGPLSRSYNARAGLISNSYAMMDTSLTAVIGTFDRDLIGNRALCASRNGRSVDCGRSNARPRRGQIARTDRGHAF
jgi:hypothetical protein